ncbi:MAG: hypothetical protein KA230_08175, partial [Flavobacteriales bacterium]|nr:hypothetical protein [Flavobacteriales bacterium]
ACEDGNACTINDVLTTACQCAGTFIDTDGDGTCDANDSCPNVGGQIGSACDDGNACTTGDVLSASCQCAGTASVDTDNDGTCDTLDCAPNDPAAFPGAVEICDGIDNDCDGTTDVTGATGIVCGAAYDFGTTVLTAPPGAVFTSVEFASYGTVTGSCGSYVIGSCHAANSMSVVQGLVLGQNSVSIPAIPSTFGIDPCVGTLKQLVVQARWSTLTDLRTTYYPDADSDGYGATAGAITACTQPPNTVLVGGDCADDNAAVNPSAAEICDGLDNDCDGTIDLDVVLRFDGSDDHVAVGSWFTEQNFTIEMWLKPGGAQNQYANIVDNSHSNNIRWVCQQDGSNTNHYYWAVASGSGAFVNFELQTDAWQHLALVKGPTQVEVYVNGTLVGTGASSGNINGVGSGDFVRLGQWASGGRAWNGRMYDARFWNSARTQAEIAAGMQQSITVPTAGLLANYRMNDGVANGTNTGITVLNDASGNAHHGTLSGFALTGTTSNFVADLLDTDGDGTSDCSDGCPNDANKTAPGTCGCGSLEPASACDDSNVCTTNDVVGANCLCAGTPSPDADGDGTCDAQDACPNDPLKIAAGACGCGVLDTDSDVDGTADCNDGCPLDPLKIAAGQCGCGVADTDTDGDGTANCNDGCPTDPLKVAVGQCGCGTADTDTDSDGIANCVDNCPTTPGVIGGACDDGNATTGNDVVSAGCVCAGQPIDCAGVPGGSATPGTACTIGSESGLWSAGCVCVVPRPDIDVQNVTAVPTTIAPSQVVTVDWTVANVGIAPSIKSWTERIFVESSTGQNRTLLKQTSFSEAGTMAVSGSISRSDVVSMPTVFVVGDQAVFVVELTPSAALVELANSTANNTGIQQTPFSVSKVLTVELSSAQLMEGAGITATVVRSGSIAAEQIVSLSITQPSRTNVPTTVTILAGQSGRTFPISALENSLLEGPISVTLTASAAGFPSVDQAITLVDNESPELSITGLPGTTMEGNSVVLTIATTFAPVSPLQVFLTSNNQPRFPVPASVTIAPGALFTTTTVNLAQDNTPELDASVTITAGAAGHTPANANTLLGDDDVPGLALILQTDTVSESGGPFATTATLHRLDGSNPIAFTGTVSANIGSTVLLPATITLAAGENDKVFYIGTVDNSLVDGYRSVIISVAVQVASCGCSAPPTSAGFVSGTIVVADNDGPSLSISATPVTLAEGLANAGTLRVARNTPTNVDLTVSLSTSNTNEATLPASVSIPIGATFLDVPITTINDGNPDGSQQVYVHASAPGFSTAVNWVLVTDINTPDLQVANVALPNTLLPAMSLFSYAVSITNSGFATAPAGVLVRAYLSQNSIVDNSDLLIAEQNIGSAIATGQTVVLSGSTSAPNLPGDYRLLFQVNPTASLTELLYTNNTSLPVMVTIVPDYTATAVVAPLHVLKNTPVPVTGTATRSSGQPAANEDVEVYVLTNGLRREILAHTDASGNYATAFVPLAAEAGHYTVGASFPGIMTTNTQDAFDILGVRINNGNIPQLLVLVNDTITGTLSVQNMSNASLTNLTIAPITVPSGAVIHFDTIPLLAGNTTLDIGYTVTGTVLTIGNNYVVAEMHVTAVQGDIQNTDLFYYCQAPAGHLTADITSINTSVSQSTGEQLVEFRLVNNGAGSSGNVQIILPQTTWLSTVTPATMPAIAPGDTALVVLRFIATADVPFNFPISSSIGISAQNGNSFSIPFTFEKVSETTGSVVVRVEDEYTYFAQGSPLVAGAHVVISNYYTSVVYADGLSNASGIFSANDIPEGTHRITVTAAGHANYQGTFTMNPGATAEVRVFLSVQAITFSWSVVPTTVPDVYEVVLTTTFQTNVPKPVVILDVPDTMPALVGNEVFAFNATLTNHGLVSARDVTLLMPTTDPDYEFITNYQPADLLALQSIQVPVLMRRRDTPLGEGMAGGPSVEGISQFLNMSEGDFDAYRDEELYCRDFAGVIYWYTCNLTSGQWEQGGELYSYAGRTCPPQLPNFGSSGGPVGSFEFPPCANCPVVPPGDGTPLNIPPVEITVEQNSCVDCILDVVDALIGCIPTVGNPQLEAAMEGAAVVSAGVRAVVCAANAEDVEDFGELLDCIPDEFPEPVECAEGVKTAAKTCFLPEVGGGFGGGGGDGGPEGRDFDTPGSVYEQLFLDMDSAIWAYEVREAWALEYFGEMIHLDAWPTLSALLEPTVIAREPFSPAIRVNILTYMSAYDMPPAMIQDFFTRWNTSMQAWGEGVTSPNGAYPDIIDRTVAVAYSDSLRMAIGYADERGYDSVWELLIGSMHALYHIIAPQSQEVCASVTVQLSQQVTMTREAFSGTLTIFNNHGSDALDSLTVNIAISNASGFPSNGLFQINTTSFNNLSDVSGTGAIPTGQEGTVNYLFIPTPEAAPLAPQLYNFGGSITYWDPFSQGMVTLALAPVILTVNPSPDLHLHYFLERNILGDDALTSPAVEPSIPAELAVMVENHGNGAAVNLTISSAQPEIVDNESGLEVNFALIGSNFQGQPVNFGVTNINFGNIPALQTRIGQWYLTSSLLGKFISYDADVVHANSFGNPQLSLVSGVHLHELTHSIRAYGALEDGINDFLVNDLFDPLDIPDVIYFSQGDSTAEVFQATIGSFSSPVIPPTFTNTLTISASEAGWNYIKLPDPGDGLYDLVSVTRGDGQVIPLNNAWLTFVTLPLAQMHVYENKFHFVDAFPSAAPVSYTVVWAPRDIDVPHIVSIDGAPQGVSTDAVQHLTVVFDKPIDPSTFTFADLDLVLQGGPDIMSAAVTIT